MKKIVTIDLWLTLIKNNSECKTAQSEIYSKWFKKHYNIDVDTELIAKATRKVNKLVDKMSTDLSTHIHKNVRLEMIIQHILHLVEGSDVRLAYSAYTSQILELSVLLNRAMLQYPPLLVDPYVEVTLQKLLDAGFDLAICSNTGLQNGSVMRTVLEILGLSKYFKHFIFSNETIHCKPSYKMLEPLISKYDKVYHIGDNPAADDLEQGPYMIHSILQDFDSIDFSYFHTVFEAIMRKESDTVTCIDIHNIKETTLDAIEYSRFKHGSKEVCEKYAKELSSGIKKALSTRPQVKNVLIYGAPYNKVPAASNFLVFDIIKELRRLLPELTIFEGKIHRKNSYHGDYGKMTKEERENVLKDEEFHFITSYDNADLAIFVDDIYITGTHEKLIRKLIKDESFNVPHIMAYYAKLYPGCCEPDIESVLNQAALQSNEEIIKLFDESLYINTRNCKYFLKMSSDVINTLMDEHPSGAIWFEILTKAIANGYSTHELYKENFNLIQKRCQSL